MRGKGASCSHCVELEGQTATTIRVNDAEMKKARIINYTGFESGVTDGARTRDNRNHNPGLYQLSYGHH